MLYIPSPPSPTLLEGSRRLGGSLFPVGGFIVEVSYDSASADICIFDNDFNASVILVTSCLFIYSHSSLARIQRSHRIRGRGEGI